MAQGLVSIEQCKCIVLVGVSLALAEGLRVHLLVVAVVLSEVIGAGLEGELGDALIFKSTDLLLGVERLDQL